MFTDRDTGYNGNAFCFNKPVVNSERYICRNYILSGYDRPGIQAIYQIPSERNACQLKPESNRHLLRLCITVFIQEPVYFGIFGRVENGADIKHKRKIRFYRLILLLVLYRNAVRVILRVENTRYTSNQPDDKSLAHNVRT